jgi:hypothetical protein
MNLRTLGIGCVSALLGLCLALAVVRSTAAQAPPNGPPLERIATPAEIASLPIVGRFQIAAAGPFLFMVDSTTGECWKSVGNGPWQFGMAPPRPHGAPER